ncbi:arsenate reductase/protein-tyrosine-phosphatase family protein [Tenggerimyces flavus]|uniref:MerR family transcriptional regulator n=1 Tax=Tenggerimyces flavus TaxID=1708749 RepID=A0ABV7YIU5_9ACTN|nr:MerR family transcriptional regulator [Tenggerimyces flavus]MBM7789711.1 protein-tyrosine-phosphatase [Tenggerimyces flavus]
MNISALARRAGISPSGVRWYESAGILPAPVRAGNGYRSYDERDLSRLTLIISLRRLGMSPVEAGRLATQCLESGPTHPLLVATLEQQRRKIAEQRADLELLEHQLVDLERTIEAVDPRGTDRRDPIAVLFVCNGNSARSQLGEALLGHFGGPDFAAMSAGTRPKRVHELAVRVLAEINVDWRNAKAKHIGEFLDRRIDYVITLSNSAREECPTLSGRHNALHWHLDDPSEVGGPQETRLQAFRATRTELTVRLRPFIEIARRAAGRLPAIAGPDPAR